MPSLPGANTSVSDTSSAAASGLDTICILAPVPQNADLVPRLFGSAAAIFVQHGYSEGVEYYAMHRELTRKPCLFVGCPIGTPGAISREDTSGNTDTCVTTVTAGGDGVLTEHDGELSVISGGIIGTDQIILGLSLDGGRNVKRIRLGTGNSYTDPYAGFSVAFAAGSLTTGETIHTWHGSGPLVDTNDLQAAREALAEQALGFRSVLLIGDLQTSAEAQDYLDELNAYATANQRFTGGRASVRDRAAEASLSVATVRMTGDPSLTFDTTGDTITRDSGSWIDDGFKVGDVFTVDGSDSNDSPASPPRITALTGSVLTSSVNLVNEGPTAGVTVTAETGILFTNSGETVRRSRGSWLNDGFRVGDSITIEGTATATNDGTFTIATLTSVLMTLGASSVDADETIGGSDVSITGSAAQTKAGWMADIADEFEPIDDSPRINLAAGRAALGSFFTEWDYRRSPAWEASIREYQHDLHVATWRKSDGPLRGDLYDTDGNLAEWDDRIDGGAGCANRFTTYRTWANGPRGAFIAMDLTRAVDSSPRLLQNNERVISLACTTVQLNTENVVGRSLVLDSDGHATQDSLSTIESEVNAALELALLQNRGEGQRASKAVWTASRDDILNIPEATLTGVLTLDLLGTIHTVNTTVRISSGG